MSQKTKHILLIVTGASPQVLTETIFALNQQGKQLPEEVFVITTQNTKDMLVNGLFTQGHWQKLIDDYQLPAITFNESNIWLIEDDQSKPILDAKTEQEQTFMADFITRKVFELTSDNTLSIHASIAGGRKTMAFYLGYAMSLLGREQDSLSHVFVNDEFEFVSDFYYPTPYQHIIEGKNNTSIDCQNAVVTLAEIPFVRMRKSIDQTVIGGMKNASFSQTVANINSAHTDDLVLTINKKSLELKISGATLKLTAKELAFYMWLLKYTNQDDALKLPYEFEEQECNDLARQVTLDYLAILAELPADLRTFKDTFGLEPEDYRDGQLASLKLMDKGFVQQNRSRLNTKISKLILPELADKIKMSSKRVVNQTHYWVNTKQSKTKVTIE